MTQQEIKKLIAQYNITDMHNGSLSVRAPSGVLTPEARQMLSAAKPEILAYFAAQAQEQQRKLATFNAIPG